MKILNLKLRGAIGIMKGLGKEEIEIDFAQFENGLIALTGKNGAGKTTVMENLHPYRTMVSRSGSLQSHFYLKDSFRILTFELDGKLYESHIKIDAITGGSEAYLSQLIWSSTAENNTERKPLNDGKRSTYDDELEKLLGSQKLFFNSVFSGQKSKGIAELETSDRRKLFYELLNLNSYEVPLEKSKKELKACELQLASIEGQISSIDVSEGNKSELENTRVDTLNKIANTELAISKSEEEVEKLNSGIKECDIEIAKLGEKQKANDQLVERIGDIKNKSIELTENRNRKIIKLNSDLEDTKKLISHNQKLLQNKDEIERQISKRVTLQVELSDLKEEKSVLISRKNGLNQQYNDQLQSFNVLEEKIRKDESGLNHYTSKVKISESNLEQIKKDMSLIDGVPCDEEVGNNCQFLKNAYSSKDLFEQATNQLQELIDKKLYYSELVEKGKAELSSKKQVADEKYDFSAREINSKLKALEDDISSIEELLNKIGTSWEQQKAGLQEAETNVKVLTEKMENIQTIIDEASDNYDKQFIEFENQIEELRKKLDPNIVDKIDALNTKHDELTSELENHRSDISADQGQLDYLKGVLSDIEAQLETLQKNEIKLKSLNDQKAQIQTEIKDWTFLTKAFDKTGIPVLKLENSGYEITTIANDLLSLFENQFRIVFETTQLTKDKKKMKETFNINVLRGDDVTEISNFSGGEQVWIETALQLAISLLIRSQGKNLKTTFLDEADGALDINNAHLYLEMLRKGHNKSGVHNTFLITHRPELLDLIPQKIELADGLLTVLN